MFLQMNMQLIVTFILFITDAEYMNQHNGI